MSIHSKKGDNSPTFGDVDAVGKALGGLMRDPELDPAGLALGLRDCGEACIKLKPGSTWNPTLGYAPWFSLKIAFPKGTRRFGKGVYEAYETLAALAGSGFDDMPANPAFTGDNLDAKKVFAALAEEGSLKLTRYGKLARSDSDPKRVEGSAARKTAQSVSSAF